MYELILPSGATETFPTLGEVLHRMSLKPPLAAESIFGKAENIEIWNGSGKCYSVEQRYNHLGVRMSLDDGNAHSIIDMMFDEVMPYARDALGNVKAPWQMTSAQWGAISAIGSVAYGVIPCLSEDHRQQICLNREGNRCSVTEYTAGEFIARLGYGHNGPVYDGENINSRHEIHVGYALSRDENIPAMVMAEYWGRDWSDYRHDLKWLPELLDKPFLRGRMSTDLLNTLISLLQTKESKVKEITVENAPFLIGLMTSLPENASFIEVDNLLYEHGVLNVRELPVPKQMQDIGTPGNAFAAELRRMQLEERMQSQQKSIDEDMAKGNLSVREKHFRLKLIDDLPNWESYKWANKIAHAIDAKNLAQLLDTLDTSDWNETTKKAIQLFYPVKLRNVSAAQRRRAVFALAGYVTDAQYADAEAAYKVEQKAIRAARQAEEERKSAATRLDDTRGAATRKSFRVSGVVMNGAEFVEKLVREGYTQLDTRKRGAVSGYILQNPSTGSFYKLIRSDGTVDYAKALLEKEAAVA